MSERLTGTLAYYKAMLLYATILYYMRLKTEDTEETYKLQGGKAISHTE
jgi:hypothetical protein